MNKQDYSTPIRDQVYALPKIVDQQLESCFDGEKLHSLMSMAEIFDVRKIYVVGCGDSWVAGGAMEPALRKYCDTFGCIVMDPMQFTRFTCKHDIGIGEPNSPLVIGISAGGGTARVVEALKKADEIGAFPILLTQNPNSPAAEAARRVFVLDTPMEDHDLPGLKNYFGSLMGLIAIACRMGHVRGVLPPTGVDEFKKAISSYVHSYEDVLDRMDD
ncbi:MAG: SIS domain-containing protein, partial [Oscillospiraceae bacterium]|nr:SIS domain-containing protein [Oscillospiraceae bacterium]